MSGETFSELEREGWQRTAREYDEFTLPATRQAFAPLLDSVGELRGRRVLEVASGTGHLAADAAARGAEVVGVDVAPNMVELARRRVPGARFHEGPAEALPLPDAQCDVALCCFGLLHFAEPDRAFAEMARVLKPGGTLAFTVWYGPDQGGEFLGLVFKAYQSHADMDVDLPPAPPMFALADRGIRDPMLKAAGFVAVRDREVPIVWPIRGPETVMEFVLKGSVRSRMIYDRQRPQAQQRICDAIVSATTPYLKAGGIPSPAVLVTATKA